MVDQVVMRALAVVLVLIMEIGMVMVAMGSRIELMMMCVFFLQFQPISWLSFSSFHVMSRYRIVSLAAFLTWGRAVWGSSGRAVDVSA